MKYVSSFQILSGTNIYQSPSDVDTKLANHEADLWWVGGASLLLAEATPFRVQWFQGDTVSESAEPYADIYPLK